MLVAVAVLLAVLSHCVSAQRVFLRPCPTGYFGPQCLPIDTSNNRECGDWRAKGWTRGDVQQTLWTERNIDAWLTKFIQNHPSLTTSSLSRAPYGFYKEFAALTGHSWDSTCNMDFECKISTGLPEGCSTTDHLNGYLVLISLENVNRFFKLARTEGYNVLIEFSLKLDKIRTDLKPDKTPSNRAHVDPAKLLNIGAEVIKLVPKGIGQVLSPVAKVLIGIYVNEPFKFVDTDLADVKSAFLAMVQKHQDNVQKVFNSVMFESPTAAGGAVEVLKGGEFLQQPTLAQSNVNDIKKKMIQTFQDGFVNLLMNWYSIWLVYILYPTGTDSSAAKYYNNDYCNRWKDALDWDMEGTKCIDSGFHVMPINYERSRLKTQRGEMRYESASNLARYIDVDEMYRQSIGCDLDSSKCTGFSLAVVRYDRCITFAGGEYSTVSNCMSKHDNGNVDERRDNIYCSVHTYATCQGVTSDANSDCRPIKRSGKSQIFGGFDPVPCVPKPFKGSLLGDQAKQAIYNSFHTLNMTFPSSWGV